jgi:hypothetical protein
MPRVYVVNKSAHDFSDAKRFGELVYLTEGSVNRFETSQIHREVTAAMRDAAKDDWLLVSALTVINTIAASILAMRFKRLNLLIYDIKTKRYADRVLILGDQE